MPEQPLSPRAVITARPTLRLDGQENSLVSELLLSLVVTESEGGLTSLEARFANVASNSQGGANLAFEDGQLLKLGARLAVYSGEVTAPREIFQGQITALEADYPEDGPPELVALAEDKLLAARLSRRSKVYASVSPADVVRSVANSLGLTPQISGLSSPNDTYVQLDESDLAFLRRLLQRFDADLQMVGEELQVAPRSEVSRGEVTLELHSQLRRVRVLADLAHQVTQTVIHGWDSKQGQVINVTSQGANPGPGSGRTGSSCLSAVQSDRPHPIAHLGVQNQEEAQALADAAFDQRARRFVTVDGTAEGNPNLRVGTNVVLSGLGPRFDNTYYIVRAVHRYDSTVGYQTDFQAEGAYLK